MNLFLILSIQKCLKYTKCIVSIACCFLLIDFIAVSTTEEVLTEIGVTQNYHYSISQTFHNCPNSEGGPTFRPGGGGGGALGYLGRCIRSLSKLKNTPKALISGQKSTLILIKR